MPILCGVWSFPHDLVTRSTLSYVEYKSGPLLR